MANERAQSPSSEAGGEESLALLKQQQEALLEQQRELAERIARREQAAREHQRSNIVVPASPSPRKRARAPQGEPYLWPQRARNNDFVDSTMAGPPVFDGHGASHTKTRADDAHLNSLLMNEQKRPSNFVNGLHAVQSARGQAQIKKQQRDRRTTDFAHKPRRTILQPEPKAAKHKHTNQQSGSTGKQETAVKLQPEPNMAKADQSEDEDELDIIGAPPEESRRRKDGTLVERLVLGPIEFEPPADDPNFDKYEPNSGIRLVAGSRKVSHTDLQAYLDNRYHLTPGLVYSLARVQSGTNHVDIDVDADFVIIGVLAWKGPIKVMNPNNKVEGKDRRCIRFNLVDLSSVKASRNGAGMLSLMLFEAESVGEEIEGDGWRNRQYRGGSYGAYEKFWKESPGAVVAILNPNIMKHRVEPGMHNTFTITPASANSVVLIGRAQDLAFCTARTAKNDKCENWCDAREKMRVCDYHRDRAVKSRGAQRAETNANSNSMSVSTTMNHEKFNKSMQQKQGARNYPSTRRINPTKSAQPDYERKIGLLPDKPHVTVQDGMPTYMSKSGTGPKTGASRHMQAITSGNSLHKSMADHSYVSGFRDGIDEQELNRRRRKREKEHAHNDMTTIELLDNLADDSTGREYLRLIQQKKKSDTEQSSNDKDKTRRKTAKGAVDDRDLEDSNASDSGTDKDRKGTRQDRKRPFSNAAVRLIGYDPTNQVAEEDEVTKRHRLNAVTSLLANRPVAKLAPPPGPRVRSGVVAPKEQNERASSRSASPVVTVARQQADDVVSNESSDDDDDLVIEGGPTRGE
ncbi:hypothetical protein OIO90_004695 [Microbotryomycetes sp. JL221]|nr:hypothetical protein OIO90_004695 [Microbotryomycetes sp. JL221]